MHPSGPTTEIFQEGKARLRNEVTALKSHGQIGTEIQEDTPRNYTVSAKP